MFIVLHVLYVNKYYKLYSLLHRDSRLSLYCQIYHIFGSKILSYYNCYQVVTFIPNEQDRHVIKRVAIKTRL